MSRKERIQQNLNAVADEILGHIREKEGFFADRWVPATEIKEELGLNYVSVPKANKQYGEKGWLFAILARMLEDRDEVEYRKVGNRAYYRSKK